jgi:hypothetical protein
MVVVVVMVVVVGGGHIVALFIHLVALVMGRAGEFCSSGVARRISLLEAGKGNARSYWAQGTRTAAWRFVVRRGWFLVEYNVRKWVELL